MYVETIEHKDIMELGRLRDITQEYDVLSEKYVKAIDNIYKILLKATESAECTGADVCVV